MSPERKTGMITVIFLIAVVAGVELLPLFHQDEEFTREVTDIRPEAARPPLLKDDELSDKKPAFDSSLADSRLKQSGNVLWRINRSDSVIKLDINNTLDSDPFYKKLYPSYHAAARATGDSGSTLLPSVNLLSGKAKQFDDGVMAAVMAGWTSAIQSSPESPVAILHDLLNQLPANSPAANWASAALDLAGSPASQPTLASKNLRDGFLRENDATPLAFYDWSDDLRRTWTFSRFIQRRLPEAIAISLKDVLRKSPPLMARYEGMLLRLAQWNTPAAVPALNRNDGLHFISPMSDKESVLFFRLFGTSGLPSGIDLMEEFIKAIRSGRIDLTPKPDSGWYDYQVFALETFLLPERGPENAKLLLTRKYKERLLEAFKSIVTKHRETHALHMAPPASAINISDVPHLKPDLRLEPNPTYYLRTARSYAFMEKLLPLTLPAERLNTLKGLKETGTRSKTVLEETAEMKDLFYGFHLLACEDIGLKPSLLAGEVDDPAHSMNRAAHFLQQWRTDPDLGVDVRMATPVFQQGDRFRNWCVLGVRLAKLEVSYVIQPFGQPSDAQGEWWQNLDSATLSPDGRWIRMYNGGPREYLLIVDEFGEADSHGPLTRSYLRKVCDAQAEKPAILRALAEKRH